MSEYVFSYKYDGMKDIDKALFSLIQFYDAMGALVNLLWVAAVATGAIENALGLIISLLLERRIRN